MRKERIAALTLSAALAFGISVPALAVERGPENVVPTLISQQEAEPLPDSMLYYGTISGVFRDEAGVVTKVQMTSESKGEMVFHISENTLYVDAGKHCAADASLLEEGAGLYVFHSAVETSSLPPQSAAFAVVRNIPMDAGCAQYHQVEAVSLENGQLKITTDNGGLYLLADEDTTLSVYGSDEAAALEDIQAGSYVMAWYGAVAESYPSQAHAVHLMLLPGEAQAQESTLTRGELAMMLYEQAGKPSVNFAMDYTDVADDAMYAEAVRWISSEGYMGGYGNGAFGPEDAVSREQLVTVLWRYAGSPMLMDYPGLSQFSDVGEISRFAQPAFAWAHQKGYITAVEGDVLAPQSAAGQELAETMLKELAVQK